MEQEAGLREEGRESQDRAGRECHQRSFRIVTPGCTFLSLCHVCCAVHPPPQPGLPPQCCQSMGASRLGQEPGPKADPRGALRISMALGSFGVTWT